jgi:hypothetical protein
MKIKTNNGRTKFGTPFERTSFSRNLSEEFQIELDTNKVSVETDDGTFTIEDVGNGMLIVKSKLGVTWWISDKETAVDLRGKIKK